MRAQLSRPAQPRSASRLKRRRFSLRLSYAAHRTPKAAASLAPADISINEAPDGATSDQIPAKHDRNRPSSRSTASPACVGLPVSARNARDAGREAAVCKQPLSPQSVPPAGDKDSGCSRDCLGPGNVEEPIPGQTPAHNAAAKGPVHGLLQYKGLRMPPAVWIEPADPRLHPSPSDGLQHLESFKSFETLSLAGSVGADFQDGTVDPAGLQLATPAVPLCPPPPHQTPAPAPAASYHSSAPAQSVQRCSCSPNAALPQLPCSAVHGFNQLEDFAHPQPAVVSPGPLPAFMERQMLDPSLPDIGSPTHGHGPFLQAYAAAHRSASAFSAAPRLKQVQRLPGSPENRPFQTAQHVDAYSSPSCIPIHPELADLELSLLTTGLATGRNVCMEPSTLHQPGSTFVPASGPDFTGLSCPAAPESLGSPEKQQHPAHHPMMHSQRPAGSLTAPLCNLDCHDQQARSRSDPLPSTVQPPQGPTPAVSAAPMRGIPRHDRPTNTHVPPSRALHHARAKAARPTPWFAEPWAESTDGSPYGGVRVGTQQAPRPGLPCSPLLTCSPARPGHARLAEAYEASQI